MNQEKSFQKRATLFLIKFFAIYAILQLLIMVAPLAPLENLIAETEAGWLGLSHEENSIRFNSHAFEIVPNCTGLMSLSVMAAIIFSLKKPGLGKKTGLFLLSAAVLFPLNLLRVYLVLLAAISINAEYAEGLHVGVYLALNPELPVQQHNADQSGDSAEEYCGYHQSGSSSQALAARAYFLGLSSFGFGFGFVGIVRHLIVPQRGIYEATCLAESREL